MRDPAVKPPSSLMTSYGKTNGGLMWISHYEILWIMQNPTSPAIKTSKEVEHWTKLSWGSTTHACGSSAKEEHAGSSGGRHGKPLVKMLGFWWKAPLALSGQGCSCPLRSTVSGEPSSVVTRWDHWSVLKILGWSVQVKCVSVGRVQHQCL